MRSSIRYSTGQFRIKAGQHLRSLGCADLAMHTEISITNICWRNKQQSCSNDVHPARSPLVTLRRISEVTFLISNSSTTYLLGPQKEMSSVFDAAEPVVSVVTLKGDQHLTHRWKLGYHYGQCRQEVDHEVH